MNVQKFKVADKRTGPSYIPELSEIIGLTHEDNKENFMDMVENGSSLEKCKLWATIIRYLPASYYFSENFLKAIASPVGTTDELSKFNLKLYHILQYTYEGCTKRHAELNIPESEYRERAKLLVLYRTE